MERKRKSKNTRPQKSTEYLVSYGDFVLPPVVPGPEVQDLCKRIDEYYGNYSRQLKKQKASDLIKGAFYAARSECKTNPDWMSQAANSLRDVLYPLFSDRISKNNLIKLSTRYAIDGHKKSTIQNKEFIKTFYNLDRIYKQVSDLTHHGTELKSFSEKEYFNFSSSAFEALLSDFISILRKALTFQQIYIHTIVDIITQKKKKTLSIKNDLSFILSVNHDTHQYFYNKADINWATWLLKNGFFDVVKNKSDSLTRYSYRTPELDYLARVAEAKPGLVADFIITYDAKINPNLETIDRFLWISTKLPAKQLKKIVSKIRDNHWVEIMGNFNHWGFEFKRMFDTLLKAQDYDSVLILAEAILVIRSKEKIEKTSFGSVGNPFYFSNLHYSEVFELLVGMEDKYAEKALKISSEALGKAISYGDKEDEVFAIGEIFPLFDVNFFNLNVADKQNYSFRDDVRDLAAVVRVLSQKIIGNLCDKPDEARRVHGEYIKTLPNARSMWRLRLYVWSLCPKVFKEELYKAFLFAFESREHLWPVTGGAEYETALKIGFEILDGAERKDFINKALDFFSKLDDSRAYSYGIFSTIEKYLDPKEKERAEKICGRGLDTKYKPIPSIVSGGAGFVAPQIPPGTEDEWNRRVKEIADLLKDKWTPENVLKLNKGQTDFYKPVNAEGISGKLQEDMKKRLPEYVKNAELFFEREKLDPHYTYSYLRGLYDLVRADYKRAAEIDWSPVVLLSNSIVKSGTADPFDKNKKRNTKEYDAWLSGWGSVQTALADVWQEILRDQDNKSIVDFEKYKGEITDIMRYLLQSAEPQPEDETGNTAILQSKDQNSDEYQASDPFSIAINSTRGRAFQAFLNYVYQDSKFFPKEAKSKLSNHVKEMFSCLLERENTKAIMFMFGHYLAFFYYRDEDWIKQQIPNIFSKDPKKFDLRLAAWEGYLAANLYKEMFDSFIDEYKEVIELKQEQYTRRKYFRDIDEGLATHIALAYIHFNDFDLNSELFKQFWSIPNTNRYGGFISFLGRHVISREKPEEWLKTHKEVHVEKLKTFWTWALDNCDDKKALQEFGFWMQAKYNIFDLHWLVKQIDKTLEKTNGDLDWEIGLIDSLPILAKIDPNTTLSILNRHLVDGAILQKARGYIRTQELMEVLKTLYTNESTKSGVYDLINKLLPIGNGQFWSLKDIVK